MSIFEKFELSEGRESVGGFEKNAIRKLIDEYRTQITEAKEVGNTEREKYLRAKIEKLNKEQSAKMAEMEKIGSVPFPELAHEQSLLNNYKRALSSMESQRKPGVKNQALERQIANMKEKVAQQERAVSRARQNMKSQMMSPYRGEESIHGTHQGKATETGYQGQAAEELSFGGGAGIKNIEYHRGSGMVSDARQMRSSAATYESDARQARTAGDTSRANALEHKAQSLRSEANSLESKGKHLMKENS